MLLILSITLFFKLSYFIVLSLDLIRHQSKLLFESYILYDKTLIWTSHHWCEVGRFDATNLAVTLTNLSLHANCSILQGFYEEFFLN